METNDATLTKNGFIIDDWLVNGIYNELKRYVRFHVQQKFRPYV